MIISSGIIHGPQKVVVYGPEGIGKSTFASKFPDPLFIDTEGSTKKLDVKRTPAPTSWAMLLEQVRYVKVNPWLYKTLVIDTADWAEQMAIRAICARANVTGIEDYGYGKGYVYLAEEFGKLLNLLTEVVDKGVNVVFTAHAMMRKFEQPDEMGAYDRWELKLQKKTAPLLKEWADMVLFANYKTVVINVDKQGADKGKNKVQGGQRIMYAAHHPCWDAKNRDGLPDEMGFDFQNIAHCIPKFDIEGLKEKLEKTNKEDLENQKTEMEQAAEEVFAPEPETALKMAPEKGSNPTTVHQQLFELMEFCGVTREEIEKAVSPKYYPVGTLIEVYDKGFIEDVLLKAWDKVYFAIRGKTVEEDYKDWDSFKNQKVEG